MQTRRGISDRGGLRVVGEAEGRRTAVPRQGAPGSR